MLSIDEIIVDQVIVVRQYIMQLECRAWITRNGNVKIQMPGAWAEN